MAESTANKSTGLQGEEENIILRFPIFERMNIKDKPPPMRLQNLDSQRPAVVIGDCIFYGKEEEQISSTIVIETSNSEDVVPKTLPVKRVIVFDDPPVFNIPEHLKKRKRDDEDEEALSGQSDCESNASASVHVPSEKDDLEDRSSLSQYSPSSEDDDAKDSDYAM